MAPPDDDEQRRLQQLRETQQQMQQTLHEIVAVVQGRYGYPGLQQRVSSLDEDFRTLKQTQDDLERDYQERKAEEAKKQKYLTIAVGGVVSVLAAVMATIIGVFVQTGLGG